MCGFILIIDWDMTEAQIERALNTMGHRGLRSKIFEWGSIGGGHVRLPILGLDDEWDHPVSHGPLEGVMVGEFLDFKKHHPEEQSDLKALLRLYDAQGPRGFQRWVDGFYHLAVFDKNNATVRIHTDFLSKKPLYYRRDIRAFASEIKPLVTLGPVTDDLNYYSEVAKFGYPLSAATPFCEIVKVPPCANIRIKMWIGGKRTEMQYGVDPWNDPGSGKKFETADLVADVRRSVEQACLNRTVADVPIGVLASGGLDSTIVALEVLKHRPDAKIFHVENEEWEWCKKAFEYVDVVPIKVDFRTVNTKYAMFWNEGPADLGSMVPQYALGTAVGKEKIRVVLSGDGADELFGGYSRSGRYDSQRSDLFQEVINYHLPRLDKMMMAHTVELRAPFLSERVVRAALRLPYDLRKGDKLALRTAFASSVPWGIIQREKKALRTPQVEEGGQDYRNKLIRDFRNETANEYRRL